MHTSTVNLSIDIHHENGLPFDAADLSALVAGAVADRVGIPGAGDNNSRAFWVGDPILGPGVTVILRSAAIIRPSSDEPYGATA